MRISDWSSDVCSSDLDVIHRERNLERETACAGQAVCKLKGDDVPPCIYSINAFGPEAIRGYSNPPDFFNGGADREQWDIPPSTVCVWPYEAMYEIGRAHV